MLLTHLLGGALAGRVFVAATILPVRLRPMVLLRRRTWVAQIPAGLLGALNPWVYDRLIEGQWGVAAALGVLFLWLACWEALQRRARLEGGRTLCSGGVVRGRPGRARGWNARGTGRGEPALAPVLA